MLPVQLLRMSVLRCCAIQFQSTSFFEMLAEKAAICPWMYIRNMSEDHRPIFRMASRSTLLRCMAMAPPARNEWELTEVSGKPCSTSPVAFTAVFTVVLMMLLVSTFASPVAVKYVLIIVGRTIFMAHDIVYSSSECSAWAPSRV